MTDREHQKALNFIAPSVIYFNEDGSVSNIYHGGSGKLMCIEDMRAVLDFAKQYIKQFKNDENIEFLNWQNEKKRDEQNAAWAEKVKERGTAPIPCFIYLLKDDFRGLHKIGRAKNIQNRISQLKTANSGVSLVAHWEAGKHFESELHSMFDDFRSSGEWFNLSSEHINQVHEFFNTQNILPCQY